VEENSEDVAFAKALITGYLSDACHAAFQNWLMCLTMHGTDLNHLWNAFVQAKVRLETFVNLGV
jgi:hypothetical protein